MQIPAVDVILSWPKANYENPPTTGPANVIITCIFYPLVCMIVAIRCYTRVKISRSFGWDDWLILAAMIPTTAFTICSLVAELHLKWNRHVWDVKPQILVAGLKMVEVTLVLFCLATTLTKLSMLVLIYRIVKEGTRIFHRFVVGVMGILILECTIFIPLVIFQCGKPSTYWTLSFEPQPQCISETSNLLAAGINNTIGDLVVVMLPIPIIWRLKLPIQQQIIIFLLFGTGLLVTVASILRTYYLYQVTSSWDKTWLASPAWISSSVELYMGIICASIPATKKFFSRVSPKLFGSASSQQTSSTRQTYTGDRCSVAVPHNVELGDFPGHVYPDVKTDSVVDVLPSPPRYSHAVQSRSSSIVRSPTTKSSNSGAWSGMDDLTRVASQDDLMSRYHQSPPLS